MGSIGIMRIKTIPYGRNRPMYQVMISLYHSPKAIRDMAKNGTIGILVLPFTRPLISGMRHQSPART